MFTLPPLNEYILFRDETEEILDSILPPREWEEDGETTKKISNRPHTLKKIGDWPMCVREPIKNVLAEFVR